MGPENDFARNAGEKLTERIDVPVGEELKGELTFLARSQRLSLAEYCREVLESHAFGEAARMRRIMQSRTRVVNTTSVGE